MDRRRNCIAGGPYPVPAKAKNQRLCRFDRSHHRVGGGLVSAPPQANPFDGRRQNGAVHDRAGNAGLA